MATDGHISDALRSHNRVRELRAKGFSWAQVVDVLALDRKTSPLRLYRLAHNRSAADVVDEVNQRDPAATATLRLQRLYDYETWPDGGRRPSVWVLPVLARIYQTSARRLLTDAVYASYSSADQTDLDAADFSHLDMHNPRRAPSAFGYSPTAPEQGVETGPHPAPPWHDSSQADSADSADGLARLVGPSDEESVALFRAVVQLEADPHRQETLFKLALGLGGVSGLPLVHKLSPDEWDRLAAITGNPARADLATVQILTNVTEMCRHLDDSRGPEPVLKAMLRYRSLVARMLREIPRSALWERLVQVYAELSQFTGWLLYDVANYAAADRHFKEGLAAAQEARDIRTIAHIHCCLTHMAAYRGEIPTALDHAFAARGWASQTGSPLLASYAEQLAAWTFAEEGWERATAQAMSRAQQLLPDTPGDADPSYLYFVDRGFTAGFAAGCWRRLNRTKQALRDSEDGIALTDPTLPRNRGFRMLDRAGALVAQKEIGEAAQLAMAIAEIATSHSSVRLTRWLLDLRVRLKPWSGLPEMRRLDARLTELNLAAPVGRAVT